MATENSSFRFKIIRTDEMLEDINEPAHTQYEYWLGTLSGDEVDMTSLGELLGVGTEDWRLIAVEAEVDGGDHFIRAWGIPSSMSYDDIQHALGAEGGLGVTRIVEVEYVLPGRISTNPPPPVIIPINTVADLFSFGFKRLDIKFRERFDNYDVGYHIHEIANNCGV
jgi:hypothetical protein